MEIVGIFLKKATSIVLLLVTAITLVLHHFLNICAKIQIRNSYLLEY